MRVMVIVKATPSSETGTLPSEQMLADMGKFNWELVQAGIMKSGDGLKPSSAGTRVRFRGTDRDVTDGPFAETKELVAGFWLWEVKSMAEAVEWVKRCPNPMPEESDIEIRPLYEAADFAESDPSGELLQDEDQLRTHLAAADSSTQPYLFFAGRCEEALNFYRQAIGAKVNMMLPFSESPDAVPDGMLQAGFENKIMHASFTVGQTTILASDGCDDQSKFEGFRLAVTTATAEQAHTIFNGLANGGQVDMPLTKTFWSPCYGMVTDKFKVGWMVMVQGQ